jgi:NADH-quinone oxidoreductase subunit I
MSLKSYVNDIVEAVATTAKGMWITAKVGVNAAEEVTVQYPEQRCPDFERFRGFLFNDVKTCIACSLCDKACPVDCISMETMRGGDKKNKLVTYDINIGRCMYCGLCVEACPPKSLVHTAGYDGRSSLDRGELILHFVEEPTEQVRARLAREVAEAAKAEAAAKAAEAAKAAAAAPPAEKPATDPEKA